MQDFVSGLKHKGHILIIDDEPYLLEGLFDVLEQEGYRVTTCGTAEESRKLSRRIDFKIALIDLKMPDSDGITLAKELKQHNPKLGIIILTAYPNQETAIEALKIGASDYLIKPVNVDELIEAINKVLKDNENIDGLETIKSELYNAQQELLKMQDVLARTGKFSTLGQVSMELFHEVKNMLAIMNISAYYLDKNIETADEKIKKHINIIKKEIQHSNKILISLLNFSKGKQDEETVVDINQILIEILNLLETELSLKSIKIVKDLSHSLNMVKGNPDKFKQVFLNFILNAKDAMSEGGELRVASYLKKDEVVVDIIDTGSGISEEDKEKIFDPFFSTKQDKEGMGLGLTVSKNIIEKYDGYININSQKGKGTNFAIKFPAING